MRERIVWVTKVISKNFVTDFLADMKNIIGGQIKSYERMIDKTLHEVTKEFYQKYPKAKDLRIEFTEFTQGAMAITVHGVLHGNK